MSVFFSAKPKICTHKLITKWIERQKLRKTLSRIHPLVSRLSSFVSHVVLMRTFPPEQLFLSFIDNKLKEGTKLKKGNFSRVMLQWFHCLSWRVVAFCCLLLVCVIHSPVYFCSFAKVSRLLFRWSCYCNMTSSSTKKCRDCQQLFLHFTSC